MQHYKQTYSKSNFHNYISSCIQSLVNILIDIHVLLMLFLSSRGFSLNILKLVILIRWSQNINRVIISFNILQIIGNYSLDYCVFGGILISNNIIDFYLAVLFCVWEYLVDMSSFFFFFFFFFSFFIFFSILVACSLKCLLVKNPNPWWISSQYFHALHISLFLVFFSLFIATI